MTQVYFENIERVISSILASSHNSIQIAVAWFTNQVLCDCLLKTLKSNQKVKIILLDDILNRSEFGLDFGKLAKSGADIRFANSTPGTMHNKFCIIDDLVITGSYNWSYHANNNNENILVTDEKSVVDSYREEFDRLFGDAIPISLPYEHLKWTDVKEGDFSELRRKIYRDVIAKNDENCELKRIKLINLNHAYKSGDAKELAKASSLVTEQHLRTITDVLTSRSQHFAYKLWEENIDGNESLVGRRYGSLAKWYYIPYALKEDKNHRVFIEGTLKPYDDRCFRKSKGLKLIIYDKDFIVDIKKVLCGKQLSFVTRESIPDYMLCIDKAKLFIYRFPAPLFNKSQPRVWMSFPRTVLAINLLGIVKEVDGDNIVFFEGWDPQKRGEEIAKEFFVKEL